MSIYLAPKHTCWWINDRNPNRICRMREDKLLSFTRIYSRVTRRYIYALHIGRIKIYWMARRKA